MKMLILALALAAAAVLPADAPRPRITGLAHVGLFVHDIEKARAYYRDVLGYDELFTTKNDDGSLRFTYFKISDRQYIELFPEREAGRDRLAHVALETSDAEGLRVYLASRRVAVPDKVNKGRIGNTAFTAKAKGASLGPDRISAVMRHAGILVGALEPAMAFYRDTLGFRETWRGSRDGKVLDWVNLQLPDGDDYIEFMLYSDLPAENARGSPHHLCLVVPDISASLAVLQARAVKVGYARPMEIRTGINRKRQLSLFDPDGTRSELMEPATIDGKPAPSSTAPPP